MEVTVIRCNGEGCGRELKVRAICPEPGVTEILGIALWILWPPDQDYCPACERKAWLAYGHQRGWRARGKLEAPPVKADTYVAPEPPLDATEVARLMGEEPPGPAPVKTQGQDGHRGKRRGGPPRRGERVRFKDGPTEVFIFKAREGGDVILEAPDGTLSRLVKSVLADLVVVEEAASA